MRAVPDALLGIDQFDALSLLFAAVVVLLGAAIKGALAFGFPLFTTPLLAALYGPKFAVVVIVLPIVSANAVLLAVRPSRPGTLRRFLPMMLVLAPATAAGSLLLASVNAQLLAVFVGALALAFTVLSLLRVRMSIRPEMERWLAVPLGIGGGLLHGISGISAPVIALYLHALNLEPRDFAYGVTLLFTVAGLIQALSYAQLGLFTMEILALSVALIPIAVVGQQLGFRLQDRLEPRRFRQAVIGVVALSSVNLLLRGLGVY
jgi:uncharacterized protein